MTIFDETVDFVVVGSGAASFGSALTMQAQGKSVVILEKSELVGGTTARSGGVMWIPDNGFLKRDGIPDSFEQASTYLNALCEPITDAPASTAERRQRFLQQAPRMLDFLMQQGIELERASYWPDYYDELPGAVQAGRSVMAKPFDIKQLGIWKERLRPGFLPLPAKLEEALILYNVKRSWKSRKALLNIAGRWLWAKLSGKQYVSAGAALQGRVLQALVTAGVDIRPSSPVQELIIENGRLMGVQTLNHGQPWRIATRLGVMVGAGGFAHNQAMRDQYQPGAQCRWSSASPEDTGEMLQEMMRLGAAVAQMDETVGNQCVIPPDSQAGEIQQPAQSITAKPHAILVDQSGVRYMNEGGSYMAYCKAMYARHRTVPAVPSWAVFDSQYMRKYMLAGTMPGKKKPQTWYDSGFLKQADSLHELAKLMAVDAEALEATVKRFNGFVDNNHDADFQRGERAYDRWLGDFLQQPNETLGRIEQGPFYAVAVYPGDVSTFGGVLTDDYARVLREDGSVIEGLYAAGVSSASMMGRVYPGAGASIGPAYTWGYVAALHAAGVSLDPD